jgi:Arc/MetJ family transcription regulator
MPKIVTFDSTIAARTRAAVQILATPALLASYEAKGGIKEDLESIRDHGQTAEALSQAQSAAQAQGGAATLAVLGPFVALQKEYSAVMAVVQAVRHDLEKAKAPVEVVSAVDKILVNEAEVTFTTVRDKDGTTKKKAVKSASQEALRAEIARDARALQNLASIHNALEKRKVNSPRLAQIITVAESLSGKLAGRAAAKGAEKAATTALHDAVSEQKQVWSACYRLLAAVGNDDARVAQLLSEAAARRSPKKAKSTKKG